MSRIGRYDHVKNWVVTQFFAVDHLERALAKTQLNWLSWVGFGDGQGFASNVLGRCLKFRGRARGDVTRITNPTFTRPQIHDS